jgi:hypothetical protein
MEKLTETSWHCIFCGEILYSDKEKESLPWYYKCLKCDVGFFGHSPGNESKAPGDSFSLTYWK